MTRPLRSKRDRISPSRPRRTASGLMSTSERSMVLVTRFLRNKGAVGSAYRYLRAGERRCPDYRTFADVAQGHNLTGTTGRSTVANQTGRPIAPARKLVAAVMGTLAAFVIVYGLGMSSWEVALF